MPRQVISVTAILAVLVLTACSIVGGGSPSATVEVDLNEWSVKPSVTEVQAGRIRFVAHNRSTSMIHELAVLTIEADGQKREVKDIEDLGPGADGSFIAKLKAGTYELACLIAPGEVGSTVDHYQMGMHIPFTVR